MNFLSLKSIERTHIKVIKIEKSYLGTILIWSKTKKKTFNFDESAVNNYLSFNIGIYMNSGVFHIKLSI